jgi:hypothetical protein
MFHTKLRSHLHKRIFKAIFAQPEYTTEEKLALVPKKRGDFNPFKVFPVEFAWQKYLRLPTADLLAWEKVDKLVVMAYYKSLRYREQGLVYDDLWDQEQPHVMEALRRLPVEVLIGRQKRLQMAFELSLHKKYLPREQWTPIELDVPYLTPYIMWVEAEMEEADAEQMAKNDILLPMFTKWNLKDYHAGLGPIFDKRHLE